MSVCFVPLCKTGLKSDAKKRKRNGEPSLSLFKPPKDPDIYELWCKAMPRVDRKLRPSDSVCELHFKEEDISRYFKQLKLFDGTIYRDKKDRVRLEKNAIPCIFSNVPGHSTYNKKRELLFEETALTRETKIVKKRKVIKKSSKKSTDGMEVTGWEEAISPPDSIHDAIFNRDIMIELES